MDNKTIVFTPEVIAQQRQISEIVNMTYENAPGSVVPLLKQLEKSQTAALDALEASMQREAEKDVTIMRLTSERDAEKRRADAAVYDLHEVLLEAGQPKVCSMCGMNRSNHGPCDCRNEWHDMPSCYVYRGPCAENVQEENV